MVEQGAGDGMTRPSHLRFNNSFFGTPLFSARVCSVHPAGRCGSRGELLAADHLPLQPMDYRESGRWDQSHWQAVGDCPTFPAGDRFLAAVTDDTPPSDSPLLRRAVAVGGFGICPMLRRAASGLARAARPFSTMASQTPVEDVIRQKVHIRSWSSFLEAGRSSVTSREYSALS